MAEKTGWWRDFWKWTMWLACYHYSWRGMRWPFTWRWRRLVREMQSRSKPSWKRPSLMMCSQHTENCPWAGECVDFFTNKIRQLIGLAGFEGAEMERLIELVFVTGFSGTIFIELQQALNIEATTMGDLLARARVLTTTWDQSQYIVTAVHSPCSGTTPPAKSDPIACMTCYRCSGKGHIAKDCRKHRTCCYQCREVGHWARECSGNEMEQGISASLLPNQDVNSALLVANIYVDGMQCSVLINTGCSQTIVNADWCWSLEESDSGCHDNQRHVCVVTSEWSPYPWRKAAQLSSACWWCTADCWGLSCC